MANKFQSAMPGALLGTDHIIAFLLHHSYLLYGSLILFSAAELITGLFLMAGFLTRCFRKLMMRDAYRSRSFVLPATCPEYVRRSRRSIGSRARTASRAAINSCA
jgi:hypothetical protein